MTQNRSSGEELKVTREAVVYLSGLYGLHVMEDDLDEITFRLNALLEEVEKLNELDLSSAEPIPMFLPVEES